MVTRSVMFLVIALWASLARAQSPAPVVVKPTVKVQIFADNSQEALLIKAAEHGDLKLVTKLLATNVTVDASWNFGVPTPRPGEIVHYVVHEPSLTALGEAARGGHLEVMRLLLQKGANPNARVRDLTTTPVYAAADAHKTAAMRLLLDAGANTETIGEALATAAGNDYSDIVALLVPLVTDPEAKRKALERAYKGSSTAEAVKMLRSHSAGSANVDLLEAVRAGDLARATQLCETADGNTVLEAFSYALFARRNDIAAALVERVPATRLDSALDSATRHGATAIVNRILERGGSADVGGALVQAVESNQASQIPALVARGADVNRRVGGGKRTLLMLAAMRGSVESVKALLAAGADVTLMDTGNNTAWALAYRELQKRANRKKGGHRLHSPGIEKFSARISAVIELLRAHGATY